MTSHKTLKLACLAQVLRFGKWEKRFYLIKKLARKISCYELGDEFLDTIGTTENYEVIDRILELDKEELHMLLCFLSGRLRLRFFDIPGR